MGGFSPQFHREGYFWGNSFLLLLLPLLFLLLLLRLLLLLLLLLSANLVFSCFCIALVFFCFHIYFAVVAAWLRLASFCPLLLLVLLFSF